ncbi:MAG: hypothetical protein MK188_14560, partial [Gammaproteobacteria bacterium]|nr:hypothetical protein [Gammaproteobacteria bacterium]
DERAYIEAMQSENCSFDIIIVDGSYRKACIENAPEKLNSDGVIIIDNTDWADLKPLFKALHKQGFRQLEFYGIGPANGAPWGTSLFYRSGNCLGI